MEFPAHFFPDPLGVGLLQSLVLCVTPQPHAPLHFVSFDQAPHPPSIAFLSSVCI